MSDPVVPGGRPSWIRIHGSSQMPSYRKITMSGVMAHTFNQDGGEIMWQPFIYLFIYLFRFFETGFLCGFGACPGTSSYRPGWPQTHRDPPASASRVLGLKLCTIITRLSL